MKHLTLSLILVVIASVIGTGWFISEIYSRIDHPNEKIKDEFDAYKKLGKVIALSLDQASGKDELIQYWEEQNNIAITFQKKSDFPLPDNLKKIFEKNEPLLLESEGEVSLHIYMPQSDLIMTILLPDIDATKQPSWLHITMTLMFYLVIIIILLVWLYPLIRRLSILKKVANKFGNGDLSSRVRLSKISYTSDIENEFNRMADRIKNLIDDNKLLSSAVSHDLKTPLTRLRFGIDVLEEATDEEARKKYIKRINKDLNEMQSLIETLLQYANLDNANIKIEKENIELSTFISDLFYDIDSPNINVNVLLANAPLNIHADPRYLAMLLNNIMTNAMNHAKSSVNIRAMTSENKISISIEDDGKGIPKDEIEKVTKPFWRGEQAIKGHGMGLAIAERISNWFDAELDIATSDTLGGASISLHFNKA